MSDLQQQQSYKRTDVLKGHVPDDVIAFTLENVFSKEECQEWIALTEKQGYEPALVNIGYGRQALMTDVRNNDRCIIDSEEMANKIFERIKHLLPAVIKNNNMIELNERLRFLRYVGKDQKFEPHEDGTYLRTDGPKKGDRSLVTLQLYLNDPEEGGATTFFVGSGWDDENRVPVNPKAGMVLVFQHRLLHEGSPCTKGIKYVMRTDIMYRRQQQPK
ncbi:hypothetical protein PPL_06695 [Heterostelium album PN500]|uniref:Fe2OG dioxygenase domain-containing protein n=1 Tax=Heterostelium pallidum (strain ATCC 26659 / Pp 5 / PN500) TaxID=670386 RepID=D3BFG1_HETP5|nr:hypothetical protein PPL_06695 [Heterostelium album PN500]EFA79875.1 hypothetical protein PPL_06695 [Heterostelium album PN500]|eukprot:XP_020431996.1 hypothetical protein PPL_06695 [Heterostelium album PN500]